MAQYRSGLLLGTVALFTLSACATPPGGPGSEPVASESPVVSYFNNPAACSNNDAVIGTIGTGIIGAGIGYLAGGAKGALIGAGAGAGTGLLIGHLIDHRRCALYQIAQANQLQIGSTPIPASAIQPTGAAAGDDKVGLNVVVADNGSQFASGGSDLSSSGHTAYSQIGKLYSPAIVAGNNATADKIAAANQRAVIVIVHASPSDVRSNQDLARLTQDRARTVAQTLADSGVNPNNIYYQGVGDASPVASSRTQDGHAAQNSVQIIDVPKSDDIPALLANQTNVLPDSADASATPSSSTVTQTRYSTYDFGGARVTGAPETVAMGAPVNSGWSFISSANAASPMAVTACMSDHLHAITAVTNLATGEALPVRDDVQGFYGAPWAGGLNGNLIDILNDVVPADSGSPIPEPKLQIYVNYHNGNNKPNYSRQVSVNVYRSQSDTLYRMFVQGPIKCMDLLVPNNSRSGTGTVYYYHHDQLYVASGAFNLQQD
jgi:outer membrane protein OmpA-like peptidoglycan-associated protein